MVAGRRAPRQIASAVLIVGGLFACVANANAQSDGGELSPSFQNALTAYDQAWTTSGLGFTTATFTDGAATGYGQYTPRDNAIFSDKSALTVYAEPVGYAFTENSGLYAYELTASFRLLNLSGQVLAEQDNFATFSGSGRSKKRELSATLTFEFSGLPSGEYRLEARFQDEVGGSQSSITLPFTVTGSD